MLSNTKLPYKRRRKSLCTGMERLTSLWLNEIVKWNKQTNKKNTKVQTEQVVDCITFDEKQGGNTSVHMCLDLHKGTLKDILKLWKGGCIFRQVIGDGVGIKMLHSVPLKMVSFETRKCFTYSKQLEKILSISSAFPPCLSGECRLIYHLQSMWTAACLRLAGTA